MIQIRKGVFETNSSSSHSIVLMKEPQERAARFDDWGTWMIEHDDGVIHFREEELAFGRYPFKILANWLGRLRYAIAEYGHEEGKMVEIRAACEKNLKGFKDFSFPKNEWTEGTYTGYVDHQSEGILQAALKQFNATIEDFIFNDRFIVIIDGDEYYVFETLVHTDMFNVDAIEGIVPDHLEEMLDEE